MENNGILIEKYNTTVFKEISNENFQVRFVFHSEENDEITYKFKDPRDTLHFLTKNWESLSVVEVETLFEYVKFGENLNVYTIMDFYYLLMLEVIVSFLVIHPKPIYKSTNDVACNGKNDTTNMIHSYNNNGLNLYNSKLKKTIRESHLYAVANTWKAYNRYIISSLNSKEIEYLEFDLNEVMITSFNGFDGIFKIYFLKDKKFILAKVIENNFYGVSKFNSYVIE